MRSDRMGMLRIFLVPTVRLGSGRETRVEIIPWWMFELKREEIAELSNACETIDDAVIDDRRTETHWSRKT